MNSVFDQIAIVVIAGSMLGVLAIYLKQPIVVAYIAAGILLGPHGFGVILDSAFLDKAGHIGVSLLLFLAGLELQPRQFGSLAGKLTGLTLVCGAVFAVTGYIWGILWGFPARESLVLGAGCMFSSTILVVKLLPTITLHQKHMGAVCIGILILQDLLAVAVIVMMGGGSHQVDWWLPWIGAPLLTGVVFLLESVVLRNVMKRISSFHESIYLLSLGWCLSIALLAAAIGLSHEVGAFIAGVSLARSPLSAFLFEGLEFMRDFFLVMFFFVLGTQFDPSFLPAIGLPALLLAAIMLLGKPWLFRKGLMKIGEAHKSGETAARLGQNSEFALILAFATLAPASSMFQMILATTLLTMVASAYWVVAKFPTPIATQAELKQN